MLAALPTIIGTTAGVLVLHRLRDALLAAPAGGGGSGVDRRRFLLTVAGGLGVAVVAGGVGAALGRRFRADDSRAAVVLPAPASRAREVAGSDPGVAGAEPYLTPNDRFYRVDTALLVPSVATEDWSLRIHGMVERERTLTYGDLLARELIERDVTLTCVSNEVGGDYVGNARWLGAPLGDLLDEVGVAPGADQLVSTSADGWTAGTPTAVLVDGRDAMLAVAMNGEPLPLAHGFPVRMVVPGLYGYVSATKWVTDMELTTFRAFDPYWIARGWAEQAPIKTMSRIDTPRSGTHVAPGEVAVAGVAWAQHVGIAAVEVQVDGGPWTKAELAEVGSEDTWRLWVARWDAEPGEHLISVRATDRGGVTQTAAVAPPFPDGATGYHTIDVTVG
jgi:DMSO/TMAO reductase YedYZ molybdopterin-dependent catalytic subunit